MLRMITMMMGFTFCFLTIGTLAQAQVIGNPGQNNSQSYRQVSASGEQDIRIEMTTPGAAYPACYLSSDVYLCRQDGIVLCLPNAGINIKPKQLRDEMGCTPVDASDPTGLQHLPSQAEIESPAMAYNASKCGVANTDGWECMGTYDPANNTCNGKVVDSICNYAVVINVGPGAFKAGDIRNALEDFAKRHNLPQFQGKHWGNGRNPWRTEYDLAKQEEGNHPRGRPRELAYLPPKPAPNTPLAVQLPQKITKPACLTKSGCPNGCDVKQDYEALIPDGLFCFDSMQCNGRAADKRKTPTYFLVPADDALQKDKLATLARNAGCKPNDEVKTDKREKDDIKAAAAKAKYCYYDHGQESCPFGDVQDGASKYCAGFDIRNKAKYSHDQYCAKVEGCTQEIYRREITACNQDCKLERCYADFASVIPKNAIVGQQYAANNTATQYTLNEVRERSQAIVSAIDTLRTDVANSAFGKANPDAFNNYFNNCYFKHIAECKSQQPLSTSGGGDQQCPDQKLVKCAPSDAVSSLDTAEALFKKFSDTKPKIEMTSIDLAHWKVLTDAEHSGLLWRMGDMGGFGIANSGNKADETKIDKDLGTLTLALEGATKSSFGQTNKSLIAAIDSSMQEVPNGKGKTKAVITFTAPEGNYASSAVKGLGKESCIPTPDDDNGYELFKQFTRFNEIMSAQQYCGGPTQMSLPGKPAPVQQQPEDGAYCPCNKPKCKHLPQCQGSAR